jgi:hypothetical protein
MPNRNLLYNRELDKEAIMSQFAPVCPPALLKDMKSKGVLGKYHLLLAHDVVAKPRLYRDIFKRGEGHYIIMDNSLIELGKPCDDNTMLAAWGVLTPDVCVLPDRLCDAEYTIAESFKAAGRWYALGMDSFLGVVQGQNEAEILECAETYARMPTINAISVPRVVTDRVLGSRMGITRKIHSLYPEIPIHLLGFSNNIQDDIETARFRFVKGIDSAVPVRAGLLGLSLGLDPPGKFNNLPPRGQFWEEAKTLNDKAEQNLHWIRHEIA